MIRTSFITILVTAVLFKNSHQHFLSFPNFPEEKRVPPPCTASINGQTYCLNCGTSAFCLVNNGLPNIFTTTCSGSTPVCGLDGSSYACIASNANCQCPGTPGLSYMADPFNDHYYTTCSGTNTIRINCGTKYYNPQVHDCSGTVAMPLCSAPGTNEDGDPTTCDGYIVCSASLDVISTGKCPSPTNYFNPQTRSCENPIPPFRCQAGYLGYYADPFDCRRYYVCNGITLIAAGCCLVTEQWDNTLGSCTTTSNCVALPLCARATTTTPTPTTSTTPLSTTTSPTPSSTTTSTTPSSTTTSTTPSSTTTSSTTTSSTTSSATPSSSTSSTPSTSTPTSSATTSSTTTTTLNPGCTPQSSFVCPAPDGYYAQCNYCARTYFQCVSGAATLRTCSGSLLFNTVSTYPACLSTCPYYP